jgi:hypothetical protein
MMTLSDSDVDDGSEQEPTICLPTDAVKSDRIAMQQCDIYEKKGNSYRVRCRICFWVGTTSSHKLIYGHYLHQPGSHIGKCVTREKLKKDYPEFYETLTARESSLHFKRK